MRETKYYCDHCKAEVEKDEKNLTKVHLSIKLDENRGPIFTIEICGGCMTELGFGELTDRNYITNYNHGHKNSFKIIKALFGGGKQKPNN